MKTTIDKLKKGDNFLFNHTIYTVRQRYSEWIKTDDPYLKTTCGQLFYHEGLEVEKI